MYWRYITIMKADHITINVVDMKKSEDFYGRILGLKQLETVDMGDHELHYFEIPGGPRIELISYTDDFGEMHPDSKTAGLFRHLAFDCEDIDALYAKFKENGVKCLTEPAVVPILNFRNLMAQDPNGVELEFIQY
jgi:4-hydroxyphenylpyruvate dioxygenase and related hemolysins